MTGLKQLIDAEGNFLPTVDEWLEARGFRQKGFDYSVVTVLGCQSSGKSTLLNELFGTEFDVMDASRGRNQTTKGLWLGSDPRDATLIIDVEGTDSRERGEDRLTFEHRAALFSLALADVVIVNMWYHDLGRYTASNYGLLKTVLGVNLELFQQQSEDAPKTIMLFVIRDYAESQTPLETLAKMINQDVRNIWKEISKPDHLKHTLADDYFEFRTVGLPSKLSEPGLFRARCLELQSMWRRELRPSSYTRKVPADGFAYYSQSVWETILKSSELDIPSQKEMLATYRCEELKNAALATVLPEIPAYMAQAQRGLLPVSDFQWAGLLVEQALVLYDQPASRYEQHVFQKKRLQLLASLQAELQKVIDTHLTHVRHRLATEATTGLEILTGPERHAPLAVRLESWEAFAEATDHWRDETLHRFNQTTASYALTYTNPEDNSAHKIVFDTSQAKQALRENLDALILRARERQQLDFDRALGGAASEKIGDLDIYFSEPDLSHAWFWKKLSQLTETVKTGLDERFRKAFMGLQTSREANEARWDIHLTTEIVTQLRLKLEKLCEWLQNHILARFQQFFEQDDEGVPRQWQELSSDKIKDIYLVSREKALVILTVLDDMNLQLGFQSASTESAALTEKMGTPLLSEARKQQILSRANRQMQQKCQEAQLLQATGGRGMNVPWWMWILLFALGYNEMAMIIFSPVTLCFTMVALIIVVVSYYTNRIHLPLTLTRQAMAMMATALIPLLSALQQGGTQPRAPPRLGAEARTLIKTEVKKEDE